MSSWGSPFSSRASENRSTPSRPPVYASTSVNSSASNYSTSSSSRSKNSTFTTNSVKNLATTVAGAFTSCFTPPPENPSEDSHEFGPPSPVKSENSSVRSRRGIYTSSNESTHTREPGSVKFTMAEIQKATRNFSPSLKIGQGGFGIVYKGRLADATLVAVKRAKRVAYDNNHLSVEFQSEIQALSKIEHLNLVKCYGYLEDENENERIIVVEYVSNGTLREHLDCIQKGVLDLNTRIDICIDVAHAITYLHTYADQPIIHRDIKSSNILLNEKLRAKVSDFGFARLAADLDSGMTHVSTQVKGTAGYLDPEYLRTYQLTEKSDVYSFGVLLIEIMTGRRPIEAKREYRDRVTARWAMKKFNDGNAIVTLDPNLEKNAASNFVIEKIYELALECLANSRRSRPSMQRCVETLWNIRRDSRELSSTTNPGDIK